MPDDSVVVTASPFTIAYTIASTTTPSTSDYDGLGALTSAYLNEVFMATSTTAELFLMSTTTITSRALAPGPQVVVHYSTTLSFLPGTVPSLPVIDALIKTSFVAGSGEAYQARLAALASNRFSSTTSFTYT
jgi:hypothetical protein